MTAEPVTCTGNERAQEGAGEADPRRAEGHGQRRPAAGGDDAGCQHAAEIAGGADDQALGLDPRIPSGVVNPQGLRLIPQLGCFLIAMAELLLHRPRIGEQAAGRAVEAGDEKLIDGRLHRALVVEESDDFPLIAARRAICTHVPILLPKGPGAFRDNEARLPRQPWLDVREYPKPA